MKDESYDREANFLLDINDKAQLAALRWGPPFRFLMTQIIICCGSRNYVPTFKEIDEYARLVGYRFPEAIEKRDSPDRFVRHIQKVSPCFLHSEPLLRGMVSFDHWSTNQTNLTRIARGLASSARAATRRHEIPASFLIANTLPP